MPIDANLGYDPTTGMGPTSTGDYRDQGYPATPEQISNAFQQNPQQILNDPNYRGVFAQLGIDPAQYDYQRSMIEADLAYNRALMGIGGGGGGGSNPVLDDLRRQANEADRSLLDVQSQLAGKGLNIADAIYKLQSKGYDTQSAINALGLKSLGVSGQQLKNQKAGVNIKDALIGLQQQGNQIDKGDVESALRTLGISRQQLGLQGQGINLREQGLDYTLQQLGLNRGAAQQSADTQLRGLKSDATSRGAIGSFGYGADMADVQSNLTRALGQIGIQESQVGLQRQDLGLQRTDLGLQGQKLTEQEGGYGREMQRLDLNDQRFGLNRQQNQLERNDLQFQLDKLGIQTDISKMQNRDIARLKEVLGLQNQQTHLDTYGNMAQLNNALRKLELDDQGIGQGAGGGGGSSALGQQALAGLFRSQAQLDALNQQQVGGISSIIQQLQQNPALAGQLFGQAYGQVPGGGGNTIGNAPAYRFQDPLAWAQNGLTPPPYMSPLGGGGIEY